MDFSLSADEKAIRDKARDFVRNELMPLEKDWPLDVRDVPEETKAKIRDREKELGLTQLDIPREYGGQGLGTIAAVLVREEYYYTWVLSTAAILHGLRPHPALFEASDYQKEKYLYPVLRGEKAFHFLFSEPGAGSDFASITTRAVREGDNYVINGMKMWSPDPRTADYLIVYAVTDPDAGYRGISAFLVDRGTPGVNVVKLHKCMGEGGLLDEISEISFENCTVPAINRLGDEGSGFRGGMSQLNNNRLKICAAHLGRIRRSLDMARDWAKERVTFGRPLADRQATQWKLAESAAEFHMARLMIYHAAWKVDQGQDPRMETAMVKAFLPEISCRIIDHCIQIFGGRGYLKETRLEYAYRHCRGDRIAEGSGEIMRRIIARSLLEANASLDYA